MSIRIITTVICILLTSNSFSQLKTENDSITLPTIYIETEDNKEPTCEMVEHPEGSFGIGIKNNKKVPGRAIIKHRTDTLYDSGEYENDKSGITIRVRGNTSAGYDKKSFKIKLQKSCDLLFRNDSSFYDKDWILLRAGGELLTTTGFLVNSIINKKQWTPNYKYVNLFLNEDYRGIYILCESIEREKNCRIYVDKIEGYIFELDPYWWLEDVYFDTSFTDATKRFTFKYPDSDEIEPYQIEYLKLYMDETEKAIREGYYPDYIDVESFARWIIAHDYLGTWDSAGSNIYMIKKDYNSKVEMATIWDFDMIMKTNNQWARVHNDYFYYNMLFNNINKEFVRTYKNIWNETKEISYKAIIDSLNAFCNSYEGVALDKSIPYDNARWGYSNLPVDKQINEIIKWFINRRDWLDIAINELNDTDNYDNIDFIKTDEYKENRIYDIYGRKVDNPQQGIYIINGKKIIVSRQQ